MDILFLTSAHNSLSQRLWVELTEQQYRVQVVVVGGPADMEAAVQQHRPDLVLCPMLTARIPDTVWRNYPCLIVHPGVVGDRGPSSLDWALMEGESRWGVTVLQAIDEMDAGPVWASQEFALPPGLQRKSSLYRHQVTEAAVIAVQEALARFKAGEQPRPLAEFPAARGQLKPQMRQQDRQIHWHQDSPQTVVRKVAAADSRPGVRARLAGQELWLFGAWQDDSLQGEPGALLARHGEAVAVGCAGGGVWLTHLMTRQGPLADIKLPALRVLNNPALPVREDAPCREIRYRRDGDVGVLSFPFYNGAMGTEQCLALRDAYREARVHGVPFGRVYDPLGEGVERCLRLFEAAPPDQRLAVSLAAFRAIWAEAEDLTDDASFARLAAEVGLGAGPAAGEASPATHATQRPHSCVLRAIHSAPSIAIGAEPCPRSKFAFFMLATRISSSRRSCCSRSFRSASFTRSKPTILHRVPPSPPCRENERL